MDVLFYKSIKTLYYYSAFNLNTNGILIFVITNTFITLIIRRLINLLYFCINIVYQLDENQIYLHIYAPHWAFLLYIWAGM